MTWTSRQGLCCVSSSSWTHSRCRRSTSPWSEYGRLGHRKRPCRLGEKRTLSGRTSGGTSGEVWSRTTPWFGELFLLRDLRVTSPVSDHYWRQDWGRDRQESRLPKFTPRLTWFRHKSIQALSYTDTGSHGTAWDTHGRGDWGAKERDDTGDVGPVFDT